MTAYKPECKEIKDLRLLSSHRSRLVKIKVALEVAANEMKRVMKRDTTARFVFESSNREIERLKKQIETVEDKMHTLIMQSDLKANYLLINSIKGVGMQTAIALIIHTNNFADFENARQLACYCGCAPFPNSSGTMDKGSHISRLANTEIKVLLTQCALSAMLHNKEIAAYADRKKAEGKARKIIVNNVRNKLVQRIFAIIRSGMPYCENYLNPLALCA